MDTSLLTKEEILFCDIYVNGTAPYAGSAHKCYCEVFKDNGIRSKHNAKMLLKNPLVKEYIEYLRSSNEDSIEETRAYLTQNLIKIIDETSTAVYKDRRGTTLSPAPLRSVAVNAIKAMMDMYPVKSANVNELNIKGDEGSGITFNVIVPDSKPQQ